MFYYNCSSTCIMNLQNTTRMRQWMGFNSANTRMVLSCKLAVCKEVCKREQPQKVDSVRPKTLCACNIQKKYCIENSHSDLNQLQDSVLSVSILSPDVSIMNKRQNTPTLPSLWLTKKLSEYLLKENNPSMEINENHSEAERWPLWQFFVIYTKW